MTPKGPSASATPSPPDAVATATQDSQDSPLHYPFDVPASGMTLEVAPGVRWIRMPMPFKLDHINVWAIEDEGGWTVVDTGVCTPESTATWRTVLDTLEPKVVTRVIATHMHPDHVGCAGWLKRKFGCELWMTREEYLQCRVLVSDTGREAPVEGETFYRRAGWDDAALETYRTRFGSFGKHVYALPASYRRITDGDRLRIGAHEWQVIVGRGHSPEHACLYCPALKLLISGDQVLPRISSNVSVYPMEPEDNPMLAWEESMHRIRSLVPDDVLVLPAHNLPFRGLHARLDRLLDGQRKAMDRLRRALQEPRRAVDVFPSLFARPIAPDDPHLLSLATGESLACLNALRNAGEVVREEDAQGVHWYRLVPPVLTRA